jgi:D-threo-aldose 1-dehydrogenase
VPPKKNSFSGQSTIVGAHTEAQVLANVSSMQATIPPEFWAELKRQNLIEQNAPTPAAT